MLTVQRLINKNPIKPWCALLFNDVSCVSLIGLSWGHQVRECDDQWLELASTHRLCQL